MWSTMGATPSVMTLLTQSGAIPRPATARIRLVAEQYPDLKASQTYAKTMDSLNSYENHR